MAHSETNTQSQPHARLSPINSVSACARAHTRTDLRLLTWWFAVTRWCTIDFRNVRNTRRSCARTPPNTNTRSHAHTHTEERSLIMLSLAHRVQTPENIILNVCTGFSVGGQIPSHRSSGAAATPNGAPHTHTRTHARTRTRVPAYLPITRM